MRDAGLDMKLLASIATAFAELGHPALVITTLGPWASLRIAGDHEAGPAKDLRGIATRLYRRTKDKATTKQEHANASRIS